MQQIPYNASREFTTTLRGEQVRIVSKPGFPNWDIVTPATALLAGAFEAAPDARVLVLGCGHGALAVALARIVPRGHVMVTDTNFAALSIAGQTLAANQIRNAGVALDIVNVAAEQESLDIVVLEAPNSRKLARRWLLEAHRALKPAGHLFLAGANREGIQSIVEDARAVFGNATVLGYKAGNRVARAVKANIESAMPPWASEPGIAPGTWHEFSAIVRDQRFLIRSLPGIFSFDRIDSGTALLLEHLTVPEGGRVLDVGCGYGIIGFVAARLGAGHVDMVDVNLLAVAAARENVALNDVAHAEAFASDALSAVAGKRYGLIASNPPFHAGRAVEYDIANTFIEQARDCLAPGGRLLLVANRFIRYDRQMRERFGNVEAVAQTGKFHLLRATSE